jgi:hypothetical protein
MSAPEILYRVDWRWPGLDDRVRYAYATRGAADELVAGLREVGWVVGPPRPAEASTRPPVAVDHSTEYLEKALAGCHGCDGTCCTGVGSQPCTCV